MIGRQHDGKPGEISLHNFVAQLRDEFDDRGCDLGGGDGVAGYQRFAGSLRRPALPAERDLPVRAQHSAHARGVALVRLQRRAAEHLDLDSRADRFCGDRRDARLRADERNLVPGFGTGNFCDHLQPEFVFARARRHEPILFAFADNPQTGRKFRRQDRDIALEQQDPGLVLTEGFGVDVHGEFRLGGGQFAVVMDPAQQQVVGGDQDRRVRGR